MSEKKSMDGESLFSAAHPPGDGTSHSNIPDEPLFSFHSAMAEIQSLIDNPAPYFRRRSLMAGPVSLQVAKLFECPVCGQYILPENLVRAARPMRLPTHGTTFEEYSPECQGSGQCYAGEEEP